MGARKWRTEVGLTIVALAGFRFGYAAQNRTQQVDPSYEALSAAAQLARPVLLQEGPQSVRAALVSILRAAGLPGGVELSACPDPTEPAVTLPRNTSVKAALDQVIAARPGLEVVWSAKNLINVRDAGGAKLLDAVIPSAEVWDTVNLAMALGRMVEDPAVRRQMESLKLQETPARLGFTAMPKGNPGPAPAVGLNFRGASLRGILNGLAAVNGRGIWVYSESGCGGERRFELSFAMQ